MMIAPEEEEKHCACSLAGGTTAVAVLRPTIMHFCAQSCPAVLGQYAIDARACLVCIALSILIHQNLLLQVRNEELVVKAAKVSEEDMASVQAECERRLGVAERKVYALAKERDALRRGSDKLSSAHDLLKEKDSIIAQVLPAPLSQHLSAHTCLLNCLLTSLLTLACLAACSVTTSVASSVASSGAPSIGSSDVYE